MRVHFAYAIPRRQYRPTRVFEKLRRLSEKVGGKLGIEPAYRKQGITPRARPLRAPHSITFNFFHFLSQKVPTLLYDWSERVCPRVEADDIVIGHPHPDPQTVIQRLFRDDVKCRLKALMFPIHHGIPAINAYALPLMERADPVLGIMGQYWYDTLDDSQFAPWKSKIIRLDMAVDGDEYPLIKKSFNPPGRRGYLYIGADRPEKGIDVLTKTMAALSDFPRGCIGRGEDIPGMKRLAREVRLTPEYVSRLTHEYDFFVNTSVSDANPTTILEAMAWGFPVACTPQSGYYNMPSIITLSTADIEANVRALREFQMFQPYLKHLLICHHWRGDKMAALRPLVEGSPEWEIEATVEPPHSIGLAIAVRKSAPAVRA
jgi:glycosyltransferase involved in cell wall biosynthesis